LSEALMGVTIFVVARSHEIPAWMSGIADSSAKDLLNIGYGNC